MSKETNQMIVKQLISDVMATDEPVKAASAVIGAMVQLIAHHRGEAAANQLLLAFASAAPGARP